MTTTKKNPDANVQVSVVFPAYNEAAYLDSAVEKTKQALDLFTHSYEIIIAEDGSKDGTAEHTEELSQKLPYVRHIHGEQRLGRGTALNNAFRQSQGEVLVYMDLDLATDLKYLRPLVEAITTEGYDFATGSRMLPESKVERSLRRTISSKSFNFLVRHMLGSKLHDHQCGFKAFKRKPTLQLIGEVDARHWFWDTEILVRAQRKGYTVKEIPVEWKSGRATKVNLFKDSYNMGKQVFQLWWKLRKE
ncbi:MAG TPA: dolichyl-phosphate beta-glucosyltransferase [Candidatus Nanoarchaeia archaeon]|nr:dolichyl-phosphate beta-glucosyltransferase [Candidatus Nanoarchaeia archaeon]